MATDWVLDASIAAKFLLEESDSEEVRVAVQALPFGRRLAPHLLRYEVGNACLKRAAKGFEPLLDRLVEGLELVEPKQIARFTPELSYYDAAYLALADERGAGLLTVDEKLRKAAKLHGIEVAP